MNFQPPEEDDPRMQDAEKASPVALENPTMEDAIAAAEVTLHGAIDYWQARARKAEAALAAPAGEVASEPMVPREDFDAMSANLSRAKNLLVRLWQKHPDARAQIEGSTGAWFVWGEDRDATPATEPAAPGYVSDGIKCYPCGGLGTIYDARENESVCRGCGGTGIAAASTVQGKDKP